MNILLNVLLFIIGLVSLLWGADILIDKAKTLAKSLGVHPIIIGITILSVGTSIPEITTSIISFISGHPDVAVGNIVGSELVQITLILGLVALLHPITGNRKEITFYGVSMIVAVGLALYVISDGVIVFFEGVILTTAYIGFLIYTIEREKHLLATKHKPQKKTVKWRGLLFFLTLGLAMTIVGSKLLISSAINISRFLNVSEYIISVYLVGLGTSLPELVVSGIAALKHQSGLSIGNLLGSNITDPTLSLGIGALFAKNSLVAPAAFSSILYLIFICIVVLGLFAWKKKFSRPLGIFVILLYIASFWII